MQPVNKNKKSKFFFTLSEILLTIVLWGLLLIAIVILLCDSTGGNWHDLALSYISGMVVYVLTVVIPDYIKNAKLKRHVINDLTKLHKEYRELLWTISQKAPGNDNFSLEQIQQGLERFNCKRGTKYICLSSKTVDILRPKCSKVITMTSLLISKHYALSVEELLVIHEITQVWFLKDIAALNAGSDYFNERTQMMEKAEYLVLRFNDLETLYFDIKEKTNRTIGWHPKQKRYSSNR